MNRPKTLRRGAVTAAALSLTLAVAGCATGGDTDGGGDGESLGTIKLGYIPGWTDGVSTAFLLEDQLEKLGYTVEMTEITDAAPLYAGLANGDVDIYPSAWPEATHADYMDRFGADIEDLGAYYDNAKLTIAVPTYMEDINSIEDLAGQADRFDGQIIGIEPGAGLTAQTESMLPEYGLDDFSVVTSSTAAMLTVLNNAIEAEEDVVVTLWRPFWANSSFDIKDLEDPKGAMGGTEALHFLATSGFSQRFPEAAEYISGIRMDDDQYGTLEDLVVNEYGEGKYAEAIDAWLAQFPDAYPGLIAD